MEAELTDLEHAAFGIVETQQKAAAEAKREEAAKHRLAKVASIMARRGIIAWRQDGLRVNGIPVTENDWPCLVDGTFVVLVESYNDETKVHGEPTEAFYVNKSGGGKLSKGGLKQVSSKKPAPSKETTAVMPSATEAVLVDCGKGPELVLVFATQTDIRKAREMGLNSGSLVATKTGDGKVMVYSVSRKETKTIGAFSVLLEIK